MFTEIGEILRSVGELLKYDPRAPLIFSSGLFLFLFAGFTFFYKFLRNKTSLRIIYVLLFSLYFYYKSSGIYFLCILLVATTDYFIGLGLEKNLRQRTRKWLVALSVAINLGMLGYFKYTNFFIGLANDMFGAGFLDFKNIFLPIGISFFVFQSMSYTIDLYRRRVDALRNWLDYAFYLSFFPVLVAGPIVRARDFIPQIRQRPLVVTRQMFGLGMVLIIAGLFKKAVISDYISLNFVDRIFDNPLLYSGFENFMGMLGYAMQIYCDFSGYSDMAIGIALLLGFRFPENFNSPYKAATITDFWRRWHISLSSWLRDYLYISLGGNRKGQLRTYANLMITMLLGGLWHGAAMRFVIWGGIHGVALAVHKSVMPNRDGTRDNLIIRLLVIVVTMLVGAGIGYAIFPSTASNSLLWGALAGAAFVAAMLPLAKSNGAEMARWRRVYGILLTFSTVLFGWILFRAPDMATVGQILTRIFTDFRADLISDVIAGYAGIFGLIALGFVLHFASDLSEASMRRRVARLPIWTLALIIASLIWVVMQIKSSDIQPFIYFQF